MRRPCWTRLLQRVQHGQALAGQSLGGQHGGGRRAGIQPGLGILQQTVAVGGAEPLAAQRGDALVMRQDVLAQRCVQALAGATLNSPPPCRAIRRPGISPATCSKGAAP